MKNLMKLTGLVFVLIAISLVSCKKESDKTEEHSPANYGELTKSDITKVSQSMSDSSIPATDASGHLLDVGDVIVYKTNEGRYGKMEILAIDDATNYQLTIKAVTYNLNDDNTYSASPNLVIRGTWICDLDTMVETSDGSIADFQWERVNPTDSNLNPENTAIFALYHFN